MEIQRVILRQGGNQASKGGPIRSIPSLSFCMFFNFVQISSALTQKMTIITGLFSSALTQKMTIITSVVVVDEHTFAAAFVLSESHGIVRAVGFGALDHGNLTTTAGRHARG